jgi:hypothetical protein
LTGPVLAASGATAKAPDQTKTCSKIDKPTIPGFFVFKGHLAMLNFGRRLLIKKSFFS